MDQQREQYLKYIEEHTKNVRLVWRDLQLLLVGDYWMDDCSYFTINSLIDNHDESKYNDNEFHGYRQWFYPAHSEDEDRVLFDRAWNHHQKTNPHHWEYWLLYTGGKLIPLDMPFQYIIEMLCDWTAMSYKFKDTPEAFYAKGVFLMSEHTRGALERWLPLFTKLALDHNG